MGHAIRSSVIIDRIKDKYDVYIFSSDRAYKYLNEKFDNVYKIGGFNTVYINNKVSNTKTLMNAIKRNPLNIKEGYEELYKKQENYLLTLLLLILKSMQQWFPNFSAFH